MSTFVMLNEDGPYQSHRFAGMLLAGDFTTEDEVMDFLGSTVRHLLMTGKKDVMLSYLDQDRMSLTPGNLLDGIVPSQEFGGSIRLLGMEDPFHADHIVTLVFGPPPDDNGELVDDAVIQQLDPGYYER